LSGGKSSERVVPCDDRILKNGDQRDAGPTGFAGVMNLIRWTNHQPIIFIRIHRCFQIRRLILSAPFLVAGTRTRRGA
jgi:hypothetical protein